MKAQARLQRRIPYLDILRVVACMLVILIHTPIRQYDIYYNTPSIAGAVYTVLVAVNCNLFFMITGALLLPVTRTGKSFVKRRMWAVVPPLLVWTVVYLLEHAFLLHNFTPRLLTSILFHPVEGLLWYVYVLVVIYVTLPLLSKCIEAIGKRGVEVLLVLWVLVVITALLFSCIDDRAGKLMIPYIVWLSFAAYLNLGVWLLNR